VQLTLSKFCLESSIEETGDFAGFFMPRLYQSEGACYKGLYDLSENKKFA